MNGYDTLQKLGCDCGCPDCQKSQMSGLGSYGKQIEWNTEPVINNYPWNLDGKWDCNDWMTWHKKVAERNGVERANEVFMIWWNKQGSFAYANDCMLLNKTFRDYFNSVGLPLDQIANFITKPFDTVSEVSKNVLDTAENISEGAAATGKTISWLVPAILVLSVAGLGYYGYKNYIKGDKKLTKVI